MSDNLRRYRAIRAALVQEYPMQPQAALPSACTHVSAERKREAPCRGARITSGIRYTAQIATAPLPGYRTFPQSSLL